MAIHENKHYSLGWRGRDGARVSPGVSPRNPIFIIGAETRENRGTSPVENVIERAARVSNLHPQHPARKIYINANAAHNNYRFTISNWQFGNYQQYDRHMGISYAIDSTTHSYGAFVHRFFALGEGFLRQAITAELRAGDDAAFIRNLPFLRPTLTFTELREAIRATNIPPAVMLHIGVTDLIIGYEQQTMEEDFRKPPRYNYRTRRCRNSLHSYSAVNEHDERRLTWENFMYRIQANMPNLLILIQMIFHTASLIHWKHSRMTKETSNLSDYTAPATRGTSSG
ncbi:hypothetical protein U1Q18_044857 [Sarracenia purpurea var. burkii]